MIRHYGRDVRQRTGRGSTAARLAPRITGIKRGSTTDINKIRGTRGKVWQRESFDRLIRCDENRRQKAEYIANNPVRWGLVASPEQYRWTWTPPE